MHSGSRYQYCWSKLITDYKLCSFSVSFNSLVTFYCILGVLQLNLYTGDGTQKLTKEQTIQSSDSNLNTSNSIIASGFPSLDVQENVRSRDVPPVKTNISLHDTPVLTRRSTGGATDTNTINNDNSEFRPAETSSREKEDAAVPRQKSPVPVNCKNRILIVVDSQSREGSVIAEDYAKDKFAVETITKPNAPFEEVAENVKQLTKTFSKNDFVIIIAGTINILNHIKFNVDSINNLRDDLIHTNCYVVSVPFLNVYPTYNQFISTFNQKLRKSIDGFDSENFKFVEINDIVFYPDVTRNSIHLTKAEKRRLIYSLMCKITNHSVNTKNKRDDFL